MGELGLLGMTVPAEFDGAGTDYVSYALAIMEIAAADGASSTAFQVHNSLVCLPLLQHGTPQQKERFLRPLARGELLGAFCLTEPGAGSDAAAITMRARACRQQVRAERHQAVHHLRPQRRPRAGLRGDGSGGRQAGHFGVHRADQDSGLHRGAHRAHDGPAFVRPLPVVFDKCEVLPDLMLGEEGQGLKIALGNLEGGRIGVAAQSVGMARAAYDAALAYARERRTFGKAIVEHQAVSFRLADMATSLQAAELMVLNAARLRDEGRPCLKEASMAKLFASEMAEKVCSAAIQIHGGYGYLNDFPVERIYRDVRVTTIYEGTSDIQRLVIGRQLANESRFEGVT